MIWTNKTIEYNSLTALESSTGNVIIGNNKAFASANNWTGQLDDIQVFAGALTRSDLMEMYRQDSRRRGYWTCDDGAGTTLTDSSGNGFDGVLNSTTNYSTGDLVWGTDGVFDGILEFDGYDDFVTLPADIIDANADWSFFAWVYYDYNSYGAQEIFLSLMVPTMAIADCCIMIV